MCLHSVKIGCCHRRSNMPSDNFACAEVGQSLCALVWASGILALDVSIQQRAGGWFSWYLKASSRSCHRLRARQKGVDPCRSLRLPFIPRTAAISNWLRHKDLAPVQEQRAKTKLEPGASHVAMPSTTSAENDGQGSTTPTQPGQICQNGRLRPKLRDNKQEVSRDLVELRRRLERLETAVLGEADGVKVRPVTPNQLLR